MDKEKKEQHNDSHVIEDYYALAQFDCLIRGTSHFPWAAQLLGEHTIIFCPVGGYWNHDKIIIDKVVITLRDRQIKGCAVTV